MEYISYACILRMAAGGVRERSVSGVWAPSVGTCRLRDDWEFLESRSVRRFNCSADVCICVICTQTPASDGSDIKAVPERHCWDTFRTDMGKCLLEMDIAEVLPFYDRFSLGCAWFYGATGH